MENCIFCKIIKNDLPCYSVYDDGDFMAFLDIRPLNLGHILLIPKTHFRWVDDVPNFGAYFELAKKIGLAQRKVLGAESVAYITAGYGVDHAHIHIIPRYENDGHGDVPHGDKIKIFSDQMMAETAEKLRKEVS